MPLDRFTLLYTVMAFLVFGLLGFVHGYVFRHAAASDAALSALIAALGQRSEPSSALPSYERDDLGYCRWMVNGGGRARGATLPPSPANLYPAAHPVLRLLSIRLVQVSGLLWWDLLLCLRRRPVLALRCMHLGSMPLVYIHLLPRRLVLYYLLRRARNMSGESE